MKFKFHTGLHALEMTYDVDVGGGKVTPVIMLIQIKAMRAAGWMVDAEGLARCLPRSEVKFSTRPPFGVALRGPTVQTYDGG